MTHATIHDLETISVGPRDVVTEPYANARILIHGMLSLEWHLESSHRLAKSGVVQTKERAPFVRAKRPPEIELIVTLTGIGARWL